jgi:hypothetical protein
LKSPLAPNDGIIADDNTSYSFPSYCTVNQHLPAHEQDQDTRYPDGTSELAHQNPSAEDNNEVPVICIEVLLLNTVRLWVLKVTSIYSLWSILIVVNSHTKCI